MYLLNERIQETQRNILSGLLSIHTILSPLGFSYLLKVFMFQVPCEGSELGNHNVIPLVHFTWFPFSAR